MKTKKINRSGHAGKSLQEKEAYRRFLSSKFELDKTEADPINTEKTSESSYEEDETPEIAKPQKKSLKLKIKDFVNNNWVITIVGGVIVAVIIALGGFLYNLGTSERVSDAKISDLNNRVEKIEKKNDANLSGLSAIRQDFEIFKTEIAKDLEFIKKVIKY